MDDISFQVNGYPKLHTRQVLQQKPKQKTPDMEPTERKILLLPYGISEKIEKAASPLGVKTIFKSGNRFRQFLSPRK